MVAEVVVAQRFSVVASISSQQVQEVVVRIILEMWVEQPPSQEPQVLARIQVCLVAVERKRLAVRVLAQAEPQGRRESAETAMVMQHLEVEVIMVVVVRATIKVRVAQARPLSTISP
jgi:hypothetical protein